MRIREVCDWSSLKRGRGGTLAFFRPHPGPPGRRSASAILVLFRGLFPHQSDDDCAAIVHSTEDVGPPPPRPSCAGDGGAAGAPPFPTLVTLSLVPLLVFMMVRNCLAAALPPQLMARITAKVSRPPREEA
jgi:hypothetical protein